MKIEKSIDQMAKEYHIELARIGRKWVKSRARGRRATKATQELKLAFKEGINHGKD